MLPGENINICDWCNWFDLWEKQNQLNSSVRLTSFWKYLKKKTVFFLWKENEKKKSKFSFFLILWLNLFSRPYPSSTDTPTPSNSFLLLFLRMKKRKRKAEGEIDDRCISSSCTWSNQQAQWNYSRIIILVVVRWNSLMMRVLEKKISSKHTREQTLI